MIINLFILNVKDDWEYKSHAEHFFALLLYRLSTKVLHHH